MAIDEMARDFVSNSSGMMGEVMNLEDFLDELSEPDPKLVNNNETTSENTTNRSNHSQRYMFNPLANLEMMFNSSNYYQQQQQMHQHSTLSTISKTHGNVQQHYVIKLILSVLENQQNAKLYIFIYQKYAMTFQTAARKFKCLTEICKQRGKKLFLDCAVN